LYELSQKSSDLDPRAQEADMERRRKSGSASQRYIDLVFVSQGLIDNVLTCRAREELDRQSDHLK
jgi:hypothetical protein